MGYSSAIPWQGLKRPRPHKTGSPMTLLRFSQTVVPLLLVSTFAISAQAQQPATAPAATAPAATAPAASAKPKAAAKPAAAKPAAAKPAATPAAAAEGEQPVLLGQFGDWGAYKATPGGKAVCFALAKPASAVTEPAGRSRDPSYMFVSTRPSEKVKNEISAIVGFPQKPGADTSATIGADKFAMYTQNDGAWVKNAADEAKLVDAMRKGPDLVLRSESSRGTKTTDTYSLKGLAQALDKVAEECR